MTREERVKWLREVDERVLPRRDWESDEEYGRRMYQLINGDQYDFFEKGNLVAGKRVAPEK